jgi:hypothetical protein
VLAESHFGAFEQVFVVLTVHGVIRRQVLGCEMSGDQCRCLRTSTRQNATLPRTPDTYDPTSLS